MGENSTGPCRFCFVYREWLKTSHFNALWFGRAYYEMNQVLGKIILGGLVAFSLMGSVWFTSESKILLEPYWHVFSDSVNAFELQNIEDNRRPYQGWNTEKPSVRGWTFYGMPLNVHIRLWGRSSFLEPVAGRRNSESDVGRLHKEPPIHLTIR